jgi:hypothetical protein
MTARDSVGRPLLQCGLGRQFTQALPRDPLAS